MFTQFPPSRCLVPVLAGSLLALSVSSLRAATTSGMATAGQIMGIMAAPVPAPRLSADGRWISLGEDMVVDTQTGQPADNGFEISEENPSPDGTYRMLRWEIIEAKAVLCLYKRGETSARDLVHPPRRLYIKNAGDRDRPMPLAWSPDSKTIYFSITQDLQNCSVIDFRQRQRIDRAETVRVRQVSLKRPESAGSAYEGYGERERCVIAAIDVATGKIKLQARCNDLAALSISPDGRQMAALQYKQVPPNVNGRPGYLPDQPGSWRGQKRCDVFVLDLDPAKRESLPDFDPESFDDVGAGGFNWCGWFDGQGTALTPVLRDILTNAAAVSWAPHGRRFAYRTQGRRSTGDVFVCDLAKNELRNLTAKLDPGPWGKSLDFGHNLITEDKSPKFDSAPLWLPDGSALLALAHGEAWLIPADGAKPPRLLTKDLPMETRVIVTSPQAEGQVALDANGRVLLLAKDRVTRYDSFWRLDLKNGKPERIADTGIWIDRISTDGAAKQLVYQGKAEYGCAVNYQLDPATGAKKQLPPQFGEPQLAKLKFPAVRRLQWKTPNGLATGVLHLPLSASPTAKVPLVIQDRPSRYNHAAADIVHGGPGTDNPAMADLPFIHGANLYTSSYELLLAGIAVFYPDIPMSDEGVYARPMKQMVEGVNAALDAVLATGVIDEKRVGLQGMKYGTYLVMSALTHTDRFKAAVCIQVADRNGYENPLEPFFRDLDDTEYVEGMVTPFFKVPDATELTEGIGRMGKPVWETPERYIENSPVLRLDRVKTPLLVIKPSDTRSDSYTGLNLLRSPAVVATYVEGYADENGLTPDGEKRIRGWFREHLLGEQPTANRADIGAVFFGGEQEGDEFAKPFEPEN